MGLFLIGGSIIADVEDDGPEYPIGEMIECYQSKPITGILRKCTALGPITNRADPTQTYRLESRPPGDLIATKTRGRERPDPGTKGNNMRYDNGQGKLPKASASERKRGVQNTIPKVKVPRPNARGRRHPKVG